MNFEIEVIRMRLATTCCTGRCFIRDAKTRSLMFECVTLEEDVESAERGKDHRIPEGDYKCAWHESSRFVQSITNVMGYRQAPLHVFNDVVARDRYILFHAGNTHLDTEGCVLLGTVVDYKGESILKSRDAVKGFYRVLKDVPAENIRVRFKNHFN